MRRHLKRTGTATAPMPEPVVDQEFLSLPNLMVTPHIAGNARESVEAMGQLAINHLVCFFKNSKDEDLS